jgi:hypothetical protein
VHVQLRVSLNEVAVLESAFDKVEVVSDELCFIGLINTFEELSIHLSLEILIHVDLEV